MFTTYSHFYQTIPTTPADFIYKEKEQELHKSLLNYGTEIQTIFWSSFRASRDIKEQF